MVRFWYDSSVNKLMVIHIPSQERKEIADPKKIRQFLASYQLTRDDCKRVREDKDRLGLFAKMSIFHKRDSN